MASLYSKKLRLIRQSEKLTQPAFAKLTGISLSSIKNYESGGQEIGLSIIERVINSGQFQKYTLWLMTGETVEKAGQIAPKGAEDLLEDDDKGEAAM